MLTKQYDKAIKYVNEALKLEPGNEDYERRAYMGLYRNRGWA
jgi:hypothetical protein